MMNLSFKKLGWDRSVKLKKKNNPHGAFGLARGYFRLEDLTILEDHQPAPQIGDQGWQVWQDCLYQMGEFRGALVRVQQETNQGVKYVILEIEFPLV